MAHSFSIGKSAKKTGAGIAIHRAKFCLSNANLSENPRPQNTKRLRIPNYVDVSYDAGLPVLRI